MNYNLLKKSLLKHTCMYYIKIPTVRFTDLVRSDPHTKHTKMNNRLYLVQVKGLSYQFPLPYFSSYLFLFIRELRRCGRFSFAPGRLLIVALLLNELLKMGEIKVLVVFRHFIYVNVLGINEKLVVKRTQLHPSFR